jgi:hypothetical protein
MKISEFVDRLANGSVNDLQQGRGFCEVSGVPVAVITVAEGGAAGRPLVVVFHGAINQQPRKIPAFPGKSFLHHLEGKATIVSVADPALSLAPDLTAAWYAGWEKYDLPAVLRELFAALQPCASRLVFTGGSVGGHPAMYHSALLPGSICITYNPIVCVSRYFDRHIHMLRKTCWPNLGADSPLSDVIQDDAGELYRAGHRNGLIYLQNATDHHFTMQAVPFLQHKLPSKHFLFLSETFASHQGHNYPQKRFANWVQASVKSKATDVGSIARIAERLNAAVSARKRAKGQRWSSDDVVVARQIAQAYAR